MRLDCCRLFRLAALRRYRYEITGGADLLVDPGIGTKMVNVVALAANATKIGADSVGWQASGGNTYVYVNTAGGTEALTGANMKIELVGAITLTSSNILHA